MNNIKNNILGLVVAALPMVSIAAEGTQAPAPKVASTKSEAHKPEIFMLNGVTKENRTGIEKLAKANGVKHASIDLKTGKLKVSEGTFNKEQFETKLTSEFPGVSVK